MRKYKVTILSMFRYAGIGLGIVCVGILAKCKAVGDKTQEAALEHVKKIEVLVSDTSLLSAVIDPGAEIEILADGFVWTEGPLWIDDQHMLLFSDVPANTIYSWTEDGGIKKYLQPSGFTGKGKPSQEPGSNGLALSPEGQLLLCQHGDRRIAKMEAPLDDPKPVFSTVTDAWSTNRYNSPNDLVVNSRGQIFFTDPPYGLPKQADDPSREISFQGVYRRDPDGRVIVIVSDLSRPNGLALSPDERTLYVSNSDPDHAVWMSYALDEHGNAVVHRLLYDATLDVPHKKGLPDGIKVNSKGIIFATGPGGVWIFTRYGNPLGRIDTGEATANCALNADESMLYMCADDYLMRVPLTK